MTIRLSSLLSPLERVFPFASPPKAHAGSSPDKKIDWRNPSTFTVKLEGGFAWRDFKNSQKFDHRGGAARLGGGLRFNLSERLFLSPRFFYEFQTANRPWGVGYGSRSNVHGFGVEMDLGVSVHSRWFSVHPMFGLGAALYRTPKRPEGVIGAQFNGNPRLYPLHDAAARVELGLQLCTWRDAFCLGARFAGDIGLNPELEFSSDQKPPPVGLSPLALSVVGGVDVLRIVENMRKKNTNGKVPVPEAKTVASVANPEANSPKENPASQGSDAVQPRTPPVLPHFTLTDLENMREEIRELHRWAVYSVADGEKALAAIKNPKVSRADKLINAEASVNFFRRCLDKTREAHVVMAGLAEVYSDIDDPKDLAEAKKIMGEADLLYKEITSRTRETHELATESIEAYNRRRGSQAELKFTDALPDFVEKTRNREN